MAGENKVRPKGIKQWIENFWYYYKIHTICVLVVLVTISVSVAQCANRPRYDYQFVLATASAEMVPKQVEAIENELLKYCTDQNGDGEVIINLIDCTFHETQSARMVIDGKKQKIQSIVTSEQDILIYLMDTECFAWLDGTIEGGFMEDLKLSKQNGKYFPLTESGFYESAKKGLEDRTYNWPKELIISRRIVKGTLIEKNKGVLKSLEKADTLLEKVIEENS